MARKNQETLVEDEDPKDPNEENTEDENASDDESEDQDESDDEDEGSQDPEDGSATGPSVYDEMLTAAGKDFEKQAPTETATDYVTRLLKTVSEVDIEHFDAMSPEAQEWHNETAKKIMAGVAFDNPEGFVDAYVPTATAPKRRGRKAKDPNTAPAEKSTEPKVRKRAEKTVGSVIRVAVIKNRKITTNEVRAVLMAEGFKDVKDTTVASYMHDTAETLRIYAELYPEAA